MFSRDAAELLTKRWHNRLRKYSCGSAVDSKLGTWVLYKIIQMSDVEKHDLVS